MSKIKEEYSITNVLLFKNLLWMKEYAFRMQNWLRGKKMPPVRIDAELHRRCNLNCIMCSRRASSKDLTEESKKIELDKEKWIQIAKESGELGVRSWNIAGISEPMCKPDLLLSVMETLKAYDIFGELTTNGTLWTEEAIKRTIRMNWDSICISIDAPNAELHDFLVDGKGAFSKAIRTIKLFNEYRKKFLSKNPSITINFVINKLNYEKLPEMVLLAKELGAEALFAEPMVVYTEEGEKLRLNKEEIKKLPTIIKKTRELAKQYNILATITCLDPDKKFQGELIQKTSDIREVLIKDAKKNKKGILRIPCYYPWFYLMIRADGSAVHCGEYTEGEESISNKTLSEVWYGEKFNRIREQFSKNLPAYCKMCRPNVIGDMRMIRRGIKLYGNIDYLHQKIYDLFLENKELKEQLFMAKNGGGVEDCKNKMCDHERELVKIKSSFPYKFTKKISDQALKTKLGKVIKRVSSR